MNGTINELKQGLLQCANENENRTYFTGQVIISSICESAKDTIEELEKENEQLKIDLKLYKKALELFVNWADECDFGYDNLGDLYSEYKDEIKSLKYPEGFIHIAVSEAKKEIAK